jgi:hypothetical protein
MRRRESRSFASLGCAAVALAALVAAGCGGSSSVTGSPEPVLAGNAVLQGTVQGVGYAGAPATGATHESSGGSGYTVTVVGAAGATVEIDEDGRFLLAGLPAGAVTLRIEGGGVSAQVTVEGLLDGQVLTVEMKLTGGTVQLTGSPKCAPSAQTEFTGQLESMSAERIVVSGRAVDITKLQKVWKPSGRAQLSDLKVGERIKVWGTLRGDGVVVADEIVSLTNDAGETWFSFRGRIDGVSGSGAHALDDVHGNPNVGSGSPTLSIGGKTIYTSASTKFKWSDGGSMDPREIKVGQTAYVEGYRNASGALKASSVVVDGTGGTGSEPSWVTFRGRVDAVAAGSVGALDVHGSPYSYSTFKVAGRTVKTDGGTAFKYSDGTGLDKSTIKVGDSAYVEGWSKPEGYVLATKFVIDK